METLAPTASPNSTQEVFRRWYLALVAVGLILTAVQAIYVPQPSPEASWIIGGLYLTAYVLYSLAPLTAVYTTRATSGLVLLLITVWITTGPLSAVLVMLIGTLLALILQHRVNDQPPRPDLARRVALEVAILAVCTALPAIVFTWLGGLTEQSGPILVQGFLLVILMGAALVLHTAVRAAVWRTVAPGDYTKRLVTWMQSSQILINLQAVILLTLLTISYYLTPWDIFSALFMMMFLAFLIIRATLVTQRELNQQVDELSSLHDGLVSINRVSNIVNASLEYSSIMEQVCTIARQLSGAASVCAFLQAEPGQPYKLIFWSGLAAEFRGALADSLPATSERWQALLTHPEGAAIPEIGADPQTAWLTPLLAGSGIQAMTVIPYVSIRNIVSLRELVPARDVIGFQALFFNERHLPGKNERHLLQMLANQAAVAIENTHLFNETQETVRRLAYLSETSRIFSSSLAMDEITQSVVNWTVDVLDFDTATLALWDAEAGVLDVQAHAVNKAIEAIPVPDIQKPLSRLPEIADVLKRPWSQVFKASETGLSPDMRAIFSGTGLQTLVLTPMIIRNDALGMLILGQATDIRISAEDVDLAEAIANQVATALQNAQFHRLTQIALTDRVLEINVLETMLRQISATMDETVIVQEVLNAAQTVTRADLLGCALLNNNQSLTLYWRQNDTGAIQTGRFQDANRGILGEAIRSGRPVVIPDTGETVHYWIPEGTQGFRSELVVPILHQNTIFGALNLESGLPDYFTEAHVRFMQNLAGHAAIALSRARLFSSNQRQIEILDAIRVLSLDLMQAANLDTVLMRVSRAALNLTGALNVHIYFYNPERGELSFGTSLWNDGRRDVEVASPRPNGLTFKALRAGTTLLSDDFEHIPGIPTKRLGLFPLIHQGQAVGSLNVAVTDRSHLGESEIRVLELITNQAASAIERVRLLETRQRQIETLERLRANSIELLGNIEIQQVMALMIQTAMVLVDAEDVHAYFYDQEQDKLTFAGSLWRDGRRNVEFSTPRPNGITYRTARAGRPQRISGEEAAFPDVAAPSVQIIQGIPLKHGDEVVGVLNVAAKDADVLNSDAVGALELLANQAAAALLRARLYEAIRSGRDQMQAILNTVRDGLVLVDGSGRLARANPAAELLLDIDIRPYIGRHLLRVMKNEKAASRPSYDFRHPDNVKAFWRTVREDPYRITQRQVEVERDGKRLYLEEETTPVLAETGEVVGRLLVWHDITERHLVEQARDELTHTIIHDLRSPLSSIKGGLLMLREILEAPLSAEDQPTAIEIVGIAEAGADGLLTLVNSLLDVARLENDDMPLALTSAAAGDVIEAARRALDMLARDVNVALVTDVPDDLPLVFMDTAKIQRVLVNLIDNALHYTPKGGRVSVQARSAAHSKAIVITVTDTGPGVPEELRDRIFERFTTGLTQPQNQHRGLGLGLTFCKLAVEAHGGRIWVEDGANGGAAFHFTLPI